MKVKLILGSGFSPFMSKYQTSFLCYSTDGSDSARATLTAASSKIKIFPSEIRLRIEDTKKEKNNAPTNQRAGNSM